MYMLEEGREPYNNEIKQIWLLMSQNTAKQTGQNYSQVDNPNNKMTLDSDDTHD